MLDLCSVLLWNNLHGCKSSVSANIISLPGSQNCMPWSRFLIWIIYGGLNSMDPSLENLKNLKKNLILVIVVVGNGSWVLSIDLANGGGW